MLAASTRLNGREALIGTGGGFAMFPWKNSAIRTANDWARISADETLIGFPVQLIELG